MLKIQEMIIVEGKYDAAKLANLVDTVILTTDGFAIFKDEEKKSLIKTIGKEHGIIILTDSDAAGFKIRYYIQKIASGIKVKNAYIPDVLGKEKRKATPSKEGTIGVEGVPDKLIVEALLQSGITLKSSEQHEEISYTNLFDSGLSGSKGSSLKRRTLLYSLKLPQKLSKKGLIDVLNTLYQKEDFLKIANEKPVLFFDFHGTLVYPDNVWVDGAYHLTTQYFPEEQITKKTIIDELSGKCLPWLEIKTRDTRHLVENDKWWAFCNKRFAEMFMRAGLPHEKAELLSVKMREYVLTPGFHRLYQDAKMMLEELQKRGYRCIMVSNNFPEMEWLAQQLGIAQYFSDILVSAKVGYDKPRKEIFDYARTLAGNPAYPVMIGDNPKDDIEGAKKAGFITVQINRYPRTEYADYWCNHLTELLALFP